MKHTKTYETALKPATIDVNSPYFFMPKIFLATVTML